MSTSAPAPAGVYTPDSDIVDFILGITFEIWEQRRVELIHRYYAHNVEVFSLEGVIRGAQAMVDGTRAMLEAFPDRLLLGDNVVWSGDRERGFYSSHRITSPMTNLGPTAFGPATGKRLRITNIADCVVENGVITREWLLRDNLALVRQLEFDPHESARRLATNLDARSRGGRRAQTSRTDPGNASTFTSNRSGADPPSDPERFAEKLLAGLWNSRDAESPADLYAPYVVMHRSPIERYSGRDAVLEHYAHLRRAFGNRRISLDHVACQPFGSGGLDIAARWTLEGAHRGTFAGVAATGKPVFILSVSHWRIAAGRVVAEWTVFDQLAVLGQVID